ncbi:hypothetical protein [Microbulbifer sp. VAAF005]|uniref:hypothetical protein n=1 Tax=Microbulbifer sp. VAAF005 TaxID=3034230 RepID=UPI0024AE7373|nr:hypothetical protein [Microbulbifer sp. VAAF005]WHI48412.1 hypothetical protein P0078_08585 [Microbulbifer sp. VAAF005]
MDEELNKLKEEKNLVTIKREAIDGHKIQGFVLAHSKELVLIQYVYDFNLDGLMVLRLSDVSSIESTKTDLFQTQIFKDEGLYSRIDFSKEYDVTNWYTVLSTIGRENGFFIIEDEDPEYPIFLLGELRIIGEDSVSMLGFSGAANWDDEYSEMSYEDISSFQVGNKYSNMYKRYFERNVLTKPSI